MTQYNPADLAEIYSQAQVAANTGRNWTEVYQAVLNTLTKTTIAYDRNGMPEPRLVTEVRDPADTRAVTWISGAKGVNGNVGAHASFIRTYTNIQYDLRAGHADPDPNDLQTASNRIASNFVYQFLYLPHGGA